MKYIDPVKLYRSYVVEVHIADLHFGSVDPQKEFTILDEQFLQRIARIDFDILSIDGDIFDKKLMANTDAVFYAIEFVRRCCELCIEKKATLFIIAGTESHDAGQLKLFYGYKENKDLDIRIVESTKFEYAHGLKILCIPEEYGKGAEYYHSVLDSLYDTVFMHGTVVGSVYGANKEDLNSSKYPIFSIDSFAGCKGPIVCGHVHKAMCLNGYIYYCSNPIRYKFGEEEDKGFIILLHDRVTNFHSLNFMPIESFRYDTIDIKTLEYSNPQLVIDHLNSLLNQGIDNIRIDFGDIDIPTTQKIVEEYYSTYPNVSIKRFVQKNDPVINTTESIQNKYSGLEFLLDPNIDGITKFVQFINHNKGSNYITVEKLKDILSGKDF